MATVPQTYVIGASDEPSFIGISDVQVSEHELHSPSLGRSAVPVPMYDANQNIMVVDPIRRSIDIVPRAQVQATIPAAALLPRGASIELPRRSLDVAVPRLSFQQPRPSLQQVRISELKQIAEDKEIKPEEPEEESEEEEGRNRAAEFKSKIRGKVLSLAKSVTHKMYHKKPSGHYFFGFTIFNWSYFALFLVFVYSIITAYFIFILYLSSLVGNYELFYPEFQQQWVVLNRTAINGTI